MQNSSYDNNPKLDGLISHRFGKMDNQICNSEKQLSLDFENSMEKYSERDKYGWHTVDHHCD